MYVKIILKVGKRRRLATMTSQPGQLDFKFQAAKRQKLMYTYVIVVLCWRVRAR